ncbi:hypothetical protein K491DRAFT_752843 [Lophiostoma macrostomum CBS 122681]|uniref:Uncharacterized protein n=1 Tax=Lophiostoma macrostomum CBS 122681 TaxID=1314788 RepID=A0A6A6TUS9_9PLEO|nr:hypothetical protein K491DRAFT_752843 [Lophiostoma macrostomum CBS 122681]
MDDKNEHPINEESVDGTPRKGGIINTLYPPGPTGGAKPRIKNHCRKFWWCDLLLFAVITLIIVLPIIYVAIPNIAQHDINDSTLEVKEMDVTSPTPDGVHLKLSNVAKSKSSFHPTIDAFLGGLSLDDNTPFININVPEVKAEAETPIVVEQDVKFASKDAFIAYNKAVMGSESLDVYLKGKTKVHQSGLQAISIDYNKKVTMKGLNKLQGMDVTDLKILSGTTGPNAVLDDGSNMIGTIYIPNPSVLLLELGNVTMNLAVDGTAVGTALMLDMTLKPGNNTLPMRSTVDQLTILGMVQSKYKNGVIPLSISGNSSVVNGQHLEYYEAAIQANTNVINLNVTSALSAIGINITSSA